MSRIIDELNSGRITVEPFDIAGAATTPTTAEYRIDDCRTGKALVGWTTLTPSSVMTIDIPGSINAIINSDRATPEIKTVTVRIDDGLSTQNYTQYTYGVQDLGFAQVA